MFLQRFTGAVKHRNRFPALLLVEITFVRYPGAADILEAQVLCVLGDAFNVFLQAFEREMAADGIESMLLEHFPEARWRKVVRSGGFYMLDPVALDLIESGGNIAHELGAQTVELQPYRTLETWANPNFFSRSNGKSEGKQ